MVEHRVYLIFGEYRGDLWSLSRDAHVWLVSSPANDAAAKDVWGRETEPGTPLRGVTTFVCDGCSAEEVCQVLDTIEDHHGDYAAEVPWTTIHVRGLPEDFVSDTQAAAALGFACRIVSEAEGFAIIRGADGGRDDGDE